MIKKSYHELMQLNSFDERLKYLMLYGKVGQVTMGQYRSLAMRFYRSNPEWIACRNYIIVRDNGCDLAISELPIVDDLNSYSLRNRIYVHHINPITIDDIQNGNPALYDPENLICCSYSTHSSIHYRPKVQNMLDGNRRPGDTCPWKKNI